MIPKRLARVNYHGMAMLLLPVILIKTLAVMFGISSPGQAVASSQQSGVSHTQNQHSLQRTWTELQVAAGAHVEYLRKLDFGIDPLLHALEDNAIAPVTDLPGIQLNLQMILSTRSGNLAFINDKQYREGELIEASPWEVILIDGDVPSVTLRHEDSGEVRILNVERIEDH